MQYELDMQSDHRDLFLEVREYLLSFDGIEETRKPRITTYNNKSGGICHMRTMPHGIDLGFLKGAEMEDRYKMLTGTGKKIRVLSQYDFDRQLLDYYLQQAMTING